MRLRLAEKVHNSVLFATHFKKKKENLFTRLNLSNILTAPGRVTSAAAAAKAARREKY